LRRHTRRGQPLAARYRYERWRDHRLVETQIDPMVQRAWGVAEFELALRQSGFSDVRVIGGYNRSRAPRAGDRVLTFEAVAQDGWRVRCRGLWPP